MKWTEAQTAELRQMCMDGISNAAIAASFQVPVSEIHAKRSALGITIPKVKAMKDGAPQADNPAKNHSGLPNYVDELDFACLISTICDFIEEQEIKRRDLGLLMYAVTKAVEECANDECVFNPLAIPPEVYVDNPDNPEASWSPTREQIADAQKSARSASGNPTPHVDPANSAEETMQAIKNQLQKGCHAASCDSHSEV